MRFSLATTFALALAVSAPTSVMADDDAGFQLPQTDIEETVYLDPYRAPQLGSDVSEFVWALYLMTGACLHNPDIANLCAELEEALYKGFEQNVEYPRYDPNYLEDLPAQLSPITADLAAQSVLSILDAFNEHGSEFKVECEMNAECFEMPYSDGNRLRVVIPYPPA